MTFNGANRRIVYGNLPEPYSIAVFGSKVYWTDTKLFMVSFIMAIVAAARVCIYVCMYVSGFSKAHLKNFSKALWM